jgi:hypothetical protein
MRAAPFAVLLVLAPPALAQPGIDVELPPTSWPEAPAAPRISVKARPWFDDVRAAARGLEVTVEGRLRDNLGQPIPATGVRVRSDDGATARATTGTDGRFRAALRFAGEGSRTLHAEYPGGTLLGPASADLVVAVGRTRIELAVQIEDPVPAEKPAIAVVEARDAAGWPVPELALGVALDAAPVTPVRTDASGRAELTLGNLTPGEHRLTARWEGDAQRFPARGERSFHAAATLGVTLRAEGALPPASGASIELTGAVKGAPGLDVGVIVTADGRPVATTHADSTGRFRVDVAPEDLRPGEVGFRALARADSPAWRDGHSDEVRVTVPPAPGRSPLWTWAPVAVAGLSLVGAAWRRREVVASARPTPPRAAPPPPPPFELRPQAATASGVLDLEVVDALDGAALPATVVLLAADAPMPDPASLAPPGPATATDAEGRIRLAGEADRVWVGAPGYAPACHACPLPPGGRAVVRLLPLRAHIQRLYEDVLVAAGRPPLRFGRQTPREAAEALERRGRSPEPVEALTALVEAACFGPEPPDGRALAAAHALAGHLGAGGAR